MLTSDIFNCITYLMYDACLYICIWKNRFNGIRKSLQTIHTGQKNILYSTGFQFITDTKPELSSFIFTYPYPKNIFIPFFINSKTDISSPIHNFSIGSYFVMDSIHIYYWIYSIQNTILPVIYRFHHFIRHMRYEIRRNIDPIHFLNLSLNIPYSHSFCIHTYDFLVKFSAVALVILDYLRLESTLPITWDINFKFTGTTSNSLLSVSIPVIRIFLISTLVLLSAHIFLHLSFKNFF